MFVLKILFHTNDDVIGKKLLMNSYSIKNFREYYKQTNQFNNSENLPILKF